MTVQQTAQLNTLAETVLRLSRDTLLVNLRFMDCALNMLPLFPTKLTKFATDGRYLLYHPVHVLKRYKNEKEASVRDYLHIVLHCVFRHMFMNHTLLDEDCWNLACDMAVEYTIRGLNLKSTKINREILQDKIFKELEAENVMFTAEKLYRYYLDQQLPKEKLAELRGAFSADNHDIWYMTEAEKTEAYRTPGSRRNNKGGNGDGSDDGSDTTRQTSMAISMTEQQWRDVAEKLQMDMELFSKSQGKDPAALIENLKEVNRERYDYTSFLKKFATMHEAMRVNDDEFDYIFYTYGLKLYKKVPLIEPLEYKDVKQIKEFVIAIDTSGSTSGELVQTFLQKTYNIIKSTESFTSRINLHIIQCDAAIQEDAKIKNQDEFDNYLKTMQIHGLGGTDFRPVFGYVDYLIEKHEFTNLKGLIYFTDGWGIFPEKKPPYETAFVFIQDDYYNSDVPPWAIKLILQKEELQEWQT